MGLLSWGVHHKGINEHDRVSFNKEIDSFRNSLHNFTPQKNFEKLGKIVNSVFSKALGIKYKFTYEDLKLESKEIPLPVEIEMKIDTLCDELNDMEFDKEKINEARLTEVSARLSELAGLFAGMKLGEQGKATAPKPEDLNLNMGLEIPEPSAESGDFSIRPNQSALQADDSLEKETRKLEESLKRLHETTGIGINEKPSSKKGILSSLLKKDEILEIPEPGDLSPEPEAKPPEMKDKAPAPDTFVAGDAPKPISAEKMPAAKPHKKIPIRKSKHIIAKPESTKPEEKLPGFSVKDELATRESAIQKDLGDIVKSLEHGKKGIQEELTLLDKEKKVLQKEKRRVTKEDTKDLPEFKVFETSLTDQIRALDNKKKELIEKEKQIDEKLKSISVMEAKLKELSGRLKNDDSDLQKRAEFLDTKDSLIKKIKSDLTKKYDYAVKEIDSMKKELKEKEQNFLKLQEFYNSRENRLSVEEGNILDEKRKYNRLVSELLAKHLTLAKEDLQNAENKLTLLKSKNKKADELLSESGEKFKKLVSENKNLKKEIEKKKTYFDGLEAEFRSKDPEYEEMLKLLEKREATLVQRESGFLKFQEKVDKSSSELNSRLQSLDLKELDLKQLEREIEKLKFDIANSETRLGMMKQHINRRIDSYARLKKEIMEGIRREKTAIRRVEARLQSKGYYIDKKIRQAEHDENIYDGYSKSIRDQAETLREDEELRVDEITVTHGYEVGNPAILDILRLLNIAKDFLRRGEKERGRDAYLEIQRLFEELHEEDREDLYPEVMKVFRTKSGFEPRFENSHLTLNNAETSHTTTSFHSSQFSQSSFSGSNIDSLLSQFETYVGSGDLQASEEIYSKLQQKYLELPKEEKSKYYSRIMDLYNKVMEQQVSTGAVM